jgi:orotate phosphoribosyltransferase
MNEKEILKIFKETGALLKGHFELSSGLHSDQYFQCALVLQYPRYAKKFGKLIGKLFRDLKINCVIGLALGGITIGYEVARSLKARALFAERVNDQMKLRRGFAVTRSDRALIVEDVITTGGSAQEVVQLLKQNKIRVCGVGSMVDRSTAKINFGIPFRSLLKLEVETFEPKDCPLCKKGVALDKPGNRQNRGTVLGSLA